MAARSSSAEASALKSSPSSGSVSASTRGEKVPSLAAASEITPPLNENELLLPRRIRKSRPPGIEEEIKRTLPAGFELYELSRYQMRVISRKLETVVLKVNVPPELEPTLREWRRSIEDKYPFSQIQIRRVAVQENLFNQLRNGFPGTTQLTKDARPGIQEMIASTCGEIPDFPPIARSKKPPRENLLDVPFIAIDRPDVLDREDLIHGERKHDGSLVLKVAIIDITDYVAPFSEAYRAAHRVGQNVYTRRRVISTIGSQLAHGPGCFKLGEARPAWVFEKRISPTQGPDDVSVKVRRAWVKNHHNLNPAEPFDVSAQPEIAPTVAALADITRVLEHHRMSKSKIIRLDGGGAASRIVAEAMIQVGQMVAKHQAEALKIDGVYWSHKKPSEEDRQSWVEQLRELKIPATISDLESELDIRGILRTLEERASPAARSLENNILDLHLDRTTASTTKEEHWALRVDEYAPFKPRVALGLMNQLAWDAAYTGAPAIPTDELARRTTNWNNRRWTRSERFFKLRVLEMLDEKLALEGSMFIGQVAEIKERLTYYRASGPDDGKPITLTQIDPASIIRVEQRSRSLRDGEAGSQDVAEVPLEEGIRVHVQQGPAYVQVDNFSKWGIINNIEGMFLKPGDPVAVILKGFSIESPKNMRFVFELTNL